MIFPFLFLYAKIEDFNAIFVKTLIILIKYVDKKII